MRFDFPDAFGPMKKALSANTTSAFLKLRQLPNFSREKRMKVSFSKRRGRVISLRRVAAKD